MKNGNPRLLPTSQKIKTIFDFFSYYLPVALACLFCDVTQKLSLSRLQHFSLKVADYANPKVYRTETTPDEELLEYGR